MSRLHEVAKSIIVATAIATALYVLVAMASMEYHSDGGGFMFNLEGVWERTHAK